MTERDRRVSDQMVRLVQIVFGMVLAQSLLIYRDTIVHPLSGDNWLPTFALAVVYITTVMSWVDWHVTMDLRPYNFDPRGPHHIVEKARLGLDLFVVILYAYLLFTVNDFKTTADASVANYLVGFPLVFLAYLLSGLARRKTHSQRASDPRPIILFFLLYLALAYTYVIWLSLVPSRIRMLNWVAIAMCLILMVEYRFYRAIRRRQRDSSKASGLLIAVDIDGVLGNQIQDLIPRVRARLGVDITYDAITEWRLPLRDSNIAKEIEIAQGDREYLVGMPVHAGARDFLDAVFSNNRVALLTARPEATKKWTQDWLDNNGLSYDEFFSVREEKKSALRADVLVDDYVGNLMEYLKNSSGLAILVDQPWNRDRSSLQKMIDNGRLKVVHSLREIPAIITAQRLARNRKGGTTDSGKLNDT